MWTPGFGEEGQKRLKKAAILVSRTGGIGSVVAYELAAAGVGKLVLAHGGEVKPSDLNRQLLMTRDSLGTPRVESSARRLRELNPDVEIVAVPEQVDEDSAEDLVSQVDLVIDAAPLFAERFAMNRAAVSQRKPLVEAAMYDLQGTVTSILPGKTPCLRCLYPEEPASWKRQFPVFGAMAGTLGAIAAMEAIKIIAGLGEPLYGKLLTVDLRIMQFQTLPITLNPHCGLCANLPD